MVYVVTLSAAELSAVRSRLRAEQRLTKAFEKGSAVGGGPGIVLIVQVDSDEARSRSLVWLGVAVHRGKVGEFDVSLTIDHLRECTEVVVFDGTSGLLRGLDEHFRRQIDEACILGSVGSFGPEPWAALEAALRHRHSSLVPILEWLGAIADAPILSNADPADRAWQEQRDAVGTIARIFKVPPTTFSAWKRPTSPHVPYLAGLIPEPVENSLIEHDARASVGNLPLFGEWADHPDARCDIHVYQDGAGRTLEVANVNATDIESRQGTDMIYYYEPTSSFILVQYKRLDPVNHTMSVDDRLLGQLDRLENVARLSKPPARPDDWRLGSDPCFLKLAYWKGGPETRPDSLAPGMYLPVSYVRLLLQDDCTLSGRYRGNGEPGRMLGYKQVPRHLVNTQFIELVQHGLTGTVGVTVEQLRDLVTKRVRDGHSMVIGADRSRESAQERQKRIRDRGPAKRPAKHVAGRKPKPGEQVELTLFPLPSDSASTSETSKPRTQTHRAE
ncbi:hypothetical protein [Nocardia cyriacigeorgica]|uniref:hypothetical protein n=1 Tax=Nocardia cyriacigeorgica TaxID=135487 RepID=UPI00158ADD9A|nr:hypothetical protein [Nocardia cyriacigeorgica]